AIRTLFIIISTLWATSWVCLWRSNRTVGSIGGMSAGLQFHPQSLQSRLGLELILIFCSRFFVMKLVRSPSWLTVPSSSRAEEMVALRPSDCPLLPPPLAPGPPGWGVSKKKKLQKAQETTVQTKSLDTPF
uniref:Uncharacterized protein n=1 Tax=Xiphophorus couchianus TaxID=32473 RepID=A0A3B5KU48_9TELE